MSVYLIVNIVENLPTLLVYIHGIDEKTVVKLESKGEVTSIYKNDKKGLYSLT